MDGAAAGHRGTQGGSPGGIDAGPPPGQTLGGQERPDVGALMEDVGPIHCGLLGRLDQRVGPVGVLRGGGEIGQAGDDTGTQQRQVTLGVGGHGPDRVIPAVDGDRLDPVGGRVFEIGRLEQAPSEFDQPLSELAPVPAVTTVGANGPEGSGQSGSGDGPTLVAVAHVVVGTVHVENPVDCRLQQGGWCEPPLGHLDRRGQDPFQRETTVSLVQGDPAVDTARYRDRTDVAPEGHHPVTFGPQGGGVGTRAGPSRAVQGVRWSLPVMDQGPQVPAHPAHVLGRHGQYGRGGDRGVGGRAPVGEHTDGGGRGHVIHRAHHGPGRPPGRVQPRTPPPVDPGHSPTSDPLGPAKTSRRTSISSLMRASAPASSSRSISRRSFTVQK